MTYTESRCAASDLPSSDFKLLENRDFFFLLNVPSVLVYQGDKVSGVVFHHCKFLSMPIFIIRVHQYQLQHA